MQREEQPLARREMRWDANAAGSRRDCVCRYQRCRTIELQRAEEFGNGHFHGLVPEFFSVALPARCFSCVRGDDPLPCAKPEEVGFSGEWLARIGETLKADIAAGRTPGGVIAIARHGKLVMLEAYGWRDKAANVAMTTDTIFNIASMTKPMTAVGALMLYEQGKILIDDPLSKYFPKFASMRVAVRDANGEPRPPTPCRPTARSRSRTRCAIPPDLVYGGPRHYAGAQDVSRPRQRCSAGVPRL